MEEKNIKSEGDKQWGCFLQIFFALLVVGIIALYIYTQVLPGYMEAMFKAL